MKLKLALSLKQRFFLQQLPILVLSILVAQLAWSTLTGLSSQTDIQELNELALKSRFYVADMGSAMKGYLLNPKDEAEFKRKKDADDNNAETIKHLKALTQDQGLLTLISELGDLDEKRLNPAEDAVMDLVKNGKFKEAQKAFIEVYMPLRQQYDGLSLKLAEITSKMAKDSTIQFVDAVTKGMKTIMFVVLLGSIFTVGYNMLSLSRTSRNLAKLQDNLATISTTVKGTSNELSASSQSLADSSSQSASAIQQSVSSMTEMSAMLSETTRNAAETSDLSKDVLTQTKDGIAVMKEMSTSMQAISASSARLKEIVRVIENIATKTNVINDVVFKTQLLAVNASIEAARAGHHGKGFAVVANEVASLAALSGKASTEINELLAKSSCQVTEIIESTSDSIREGERTSEKSSQVFEAITSSVETISEKVEQISAASREQESGVSQTSAALSQMNRATTETNALAQKNAQLGDSIMNMAERIRLVDRAMRFIVTGREETAKPSKNKLSKVDQILLAGSEPIAAKSVEPSTAEPQEATVKSGKLALAKSIVEKRKFKKSA